MKNIFQFSLLFLTLLSSLLVHAEVRVGYQTGVEPAKVGIVDGAYEKATGEKISWRRFDNGSELIRAVASGDIDVANVGSSIIAVAASRNLPIETFLVASELGTSEALVARNGSGINSYQDLIGKTIAVPYVSTSHYSLLAALKHWGIDRSKVKIINLRVSEIPAAWQRGNIDAAYVWDPALGKIKTSGKVLTSSEEVASWGSPTFDVWVARKDFAEKNPKFLEAFTKTSVDYYVAYKLSKKALLVDQAYLSKIARITGAQESQIADLLQGNQYPLADRQRQLLDSVVIKAISDTALFLKEQGKIDKLLPDYRSYSTAKFIEK
ncbi:MAG: taurine ABC transporter substrate-binding protein [Methylotenera sp.]|nr:taurine ABC transporter substrate-binding protein [Methylotenera sp.]